MALPRMLASIFVCVTFHWQPAKLVYLEEVLRSLTSYRTYIEVVVVTDHASKLEAVLEEWQDVPPELQAVQAADDPADTNLYRLLWAHRSIIQDAYQKDHFTTYLYLEDDQIISWPSLVSWGWDMQALQPGRWQRGFFRTEVSSDHGHEVMLDVVSQINMSNYSRIVDLGSEDIAGLHPCSPAYHEAHEKETRRWCHDHGKCECYHQYYLQMIEPFQGFWIATHSLLGRFIESKWWEKESALSQSIEGILAVGGYPERTTWGVQLFDIPDGFESAIVVPYDPSNMQLEHIAKVRHLRNGYSGSSGHAKLSVSEVLVQN